MIKKAFTLLEIVILVSLIAIIAVTLIALINPKTLVNRASDITRKKHLDDAKKILEEYMADTGCYPKPTQICAKTTTEGNCTVCANGAAPQFSYFTKNICDPKRLTDYLYETEATTFKGVTTVSTCPKWFKMYTVLDGVYDSAQDTLGCGDGGCGIAPNYGYDYLVMSPGTSTDGSVTSNFFCHTDSNDCSQCTPYLDCIKVGLECFGKTIYPSRGICCNLFPGAGNCN